MALLQPAQRNCSGAMFQARARASSVPFWLAIKTSQAPQYSPQIESYRKFMATYLPPEQNTSGLFITGAL
jgi:hypothetical protein